MGLVTRKTPSLRGGVCNNRKIFLSVNFILLDAAVNVPVWGNLPKFVIKVLIINSKYITIRLFKIIPSTPL
jgi:hypothetical protein